MAYLLVFFLLKLYSIIYFPRTSRSISYLIRRFIFSIQCLNRTSLYYDFHHDLIEGGNWGALSPCCRQCSHAKLHDELLWLYKSHNLLLSAYMLEKEWAIWQWKFDNWICISNMLYQLPRFSTSTPCTPKLSECPVSKFQATSIKLR